ncbi:MAG: tRNA (adenosine(37)-N6)-threonylcarbamoyltransferase complex ATPase subunit type 1 TsaE [Chlamydiia bacterium]|nr:tRNA (adenosine(37)-N6)-threonylcarbamoyltransferase complex ATPase subunit type 1 TsaE [Chlamydiia bacterium]
MKTLLTTLEETLAFGCRLAETLPDGAVVCLTGDLGAGKTSLVKGLARAYQIHEDSVSSPTFPLLHIYEGLKTVHHFDLYRINSAEEFIAMGFDEHLFAGGIAVIEWPERIREILPESALWIHLEHADKGRLIEIQ